MIHLKKMIVISWKGLIIPSLTFILLSSIAFYMDISLVRRAQPAIRQSDLPQSPSEGLCRDALKTILLPYVQEAVDEYYEENTGYSPTVDLWGNTDIISIKSPKAYTFDIEFEVSPYLGAHNSIGLDRITLKVSYGEVEVEKYEHVKSYPIPPWLQPLE